MVEARAETAEVNAACGRRRRDGGGGGVRRTHDGAGKRRIGEFAGIFARAPPRWLLPRKRRANEEERGRAGSKCPK